MTERPQWAVGGRRASTTSAYSRSSDGGADGLPEALAPARWEERNTAAIAGAVRALTTLAPIKPWKYWFLRAFFWLRRNFALYRTWRARPLRRLSFIHFARWALITELAGNEGAPNERLGCAYVYFDTNFNGFFDEYIDAFSSVIPQHMSDIWRGGHGFPGPQPASTFKEYIARQEIPAVHYYSAYEQSSVTDIEAALQVAESLRALARAHPRVSHHEFVERWRRLLRDHQRSL